MNRSLLLLFCFFSFPCLSQSLDSYADSTNKYDGRDNKKALEYYLKIYKILETDSSATLTYANCLGKIGLLYKKMTDYREAEPWLIKSKAISELISGKNFEYAVCCFQLASLYAEMGQYKKAEEYYLEAIFTGEKVGGKETVEYGSFCNHLAELYDVRGDYKRAEFFYMEAKAIMEKLFGKKHLFYASSCKNLAQLYYYTGEYAKAKPLFAEAKAIVTKALGKKSPDYEGLYSSLGRAYLAWGEYQMAESVFIQGRYLAESQYGKEHPEYAHYCNNLALVYREVGKFEEAELLFLQAKSIRAKVLGTDHPDFAITCNDLAKLYYYTGEYEKAEPLFLSAKSVREKALGKENIHYAATCGDLAELYSEMGQYEKAESLCLESRSIIAGTLGKEHLQYAAACSRLAKLYLRMRLYIKAEPLFKYSKAIVEKALGKMNHHYALACNDLAVLYESIKQYDKAALLILEAKDIVAKGLGKEHADYAAICNNLGNLYTMAGLYEKAEAMLNEAKLINEKVLGKEHPTYATNCGDLALLYWRLGKSEMAGPLFYEQFNRQHLQLKKILNFTSEKEKEQYLKNMVKGNNLYYSFCYSQKNAEAAFNVSTLSRNLILLSSQLLKRVIKNSNDTAVIRDYEILTNLKKQLTVFYSKGQMNSYLKDLEDSAIVLEKKLARVSVAFKKQEEEKNWKDVHKALKADEAAIEFVEFKYYNGKRWTDSTFYIALLLKKDKAEPQMIHLFEKKQLDTLLVQTGNNINNDNVKILYKSRGVGILAAKTIKHSLYDLVWKPLENELKGVNTIYFSPAGLLHRVSFAALPINDREVLNDHYKLVQLSTTESITDEESFSIAAADKITLYGDIKYNVDTTELKTVALTYHYTYSGNRSLSSDLNRSGIWNELPGTKKEIEAIVSIGQKSNIISVISGINATEESFKALDGIKAPVVLHIATHGFFFPTLKQEKIDGVERTEERRAPFEIADDPLFRSGLLFAGANAAWNGKPVDAIEDGILTAYEVSNMYFPNTKLVVLSACETGLGDIEGSEGVYGLQRAFKMAGAQNLVMSLWKVPDIETVEFMREFYKNLFSKQSIADAFYKAQTMMKNKYRDEPYKWAGWVLVR